MDQTLTGLLEATAANGKAQFGIGETGEFWSLADLLTESRVTAAALYDQGVRPGSFVGLILQNDPSFLRTMFGVLYAGAVPVPLALPFAFGGMDEYSAHLSRIVADCDMRHLAIGQQMRRVRHRLDDLLSGTTLIAVEDLPLSGRELSVAAEPDALALLQYTSGSTAAPKGVRLTHRNVAAGLHAIRTASQLSPSDILGAWLPLFHDMGIFSVLSALSAGGTVWLWQPGSFIRHPARWLVEFSRHACTVCAAPNFFFEHITQAADDLPDGGVDLSTWRLAYNGAEPVNACTVERFTQRFADAGLRAETMYPVYGMAEATLAVTFPRVGDPPRVLSVDRSELGLDGRAVPVEPGSNRSRLVVGVGRAVPGMRLRIVAPDGQTAPEGTIGEIQISGPSVTSGYHRHPRDVSHTPDGWLRTGDLGFLDDEELFVVGRIKDVVIVHGINYYAEDAEALVRDAAGVFAKRCAAVSTTIEDGTEMLALVAETPIEEPAARDELVRALRARLSAGLGLPAVVHLVAPHALPLTSSGKIRRLRVRDRLASGDLVRLQTIDSTAS